MGCLRPCDVNQRVAEVQDIEIILLGNVHEMLLVLLPRPLNQFINHSLPRV
jgi:hypothetical protein